MSINKDDFVQLCEVGDELFKVRKDKIVTITIKEVKQLPHYVYKDDKGESYFNRNIIKSCFKTMDEAEEELQRRANIAKKRQLLKQYEKELNVRFNITNHNIIP